jgi:hypothetical protein
VDRKKIFLPHTFSMPILGLVQNEDPHLCMVRAIDIKCPQSIVLALAFRKGLFKGHNEILQHSGTVCSAPKFSLSAWVAWEMSPQKSIQYSGSGNANLKKHLKVLVSQGFRL